MIKKAPSAQPLGDHIGSPLRLLFHALRLSALSPLLPCASAPLQLFPCSSAPLHPCSWVTTEGRPYNPETNSCLSGNTHIFLRGGKESSPSQCRRERIPAGFGINQLAILKRNFCRLAYFQFYVIPNAFIAAVMGSEKKIAPGKDSCGFAIKFRHCSTLDMAIVTSIFSSSDVGFPPSPAQTPRPSQGHTGVPACRRGSHWDRRQL